MNIDYAERDSKGNAVYKVTEVTNTAFEMAVTKYDWNLIASDMKTKVFSPLFLK